MIREFGPMGNRKDPAPTWKTRRRFPKRPGTNLRKDSKTFSKKTRSGIVAVLVPSSKELQLDTYVPLARTVFLLKVCSIEQGASA
jgi:hypothetical protein